jgi:hypothetical protein
LRPRVAVSAKADSPQEGIFVEQIPQAITTTYDLVRPPQEEYQEERPIAARSPHVLLGDRAVLRRASTPWLALAASARACGRSRP